MNSTTLKHHKLITLLTELALVCLVFVTIVACISACNKKEYTHDGLVAWYDGTNHAATTDSDVWKDLSDKAIHVSIPDSVNRGELQTDESGKYSYTLSGSHVEAVTDETGKIHYIVKFQDSQSNLEGGNKSEHVAYGIAYIINNTCYVFACVLLLLYALKFYNHNIAATMMGFVFILPLVSAVINLCFTLSRHFDFLLVVSDLLEIILFAAMAALAFKNKLSPKVSLIAMICALVNIATPVITGTLLIGDVLNTITNLLALVGLATFTVAWFLCTVKVQVTAPEAEPVVANTAE